MKRRYFFKTFSILIIILILQSATILMAAEKKYSMDFENADIRVIIKFISELTGKNIIIGNKVKGKVTVSSPSKITAVEAYKVFQSILEVSGFSAVESAGIIKILPKPDASKTLTVTKVGNDAAQIAKDDGMVTQIVLLKNAASSSVRKALVPLISRNGIMIEYAPTNTLIITDISSNIRRLLKIIHEIDTDLMTEKIEVITLKFADAENLSKHLLSIFPIQSKGTMRSSKVKKASSNRTVLKIIPYERTNSLIIVAIDDEISAIKDLLKVMDVGTSIEGGQIHVYYLKNAVAEDLSKVLAVMTGKKKKTASGRKGHSDGAPISGDILITPDKATNSLVIIASSNDYKTVKGVIEKLDIRRRQVYVEATIMEISMDTQRDLGIEFRATTDPSQTSGVRVIGGSNFGGIQPASADALGFAGQQGLVVGAVKGTITFGGAVFNNIGALLRALETESGVNILSTPHLMTTDNEEAEIIIGENVPFITGTSQSTGGNVLTTIERKDVGIKLKITPQINESDFVKLKIYQEISDVKELQLENAADLMTTIRSASTTVVVKDNQTVAIGGLIRDNATIVKTKVPFLGDIPILGALFRSTSNIKKKTNLLIFLTPKIIKDSETIDKITMEKRGEMNKHRELQKNRPEGRERKNELVTPDPEEGN